MDWWRRHNPEAVAMVDGSTAKGGGGSAATAYICQNFACRAPTADPAKVAQLLAEPRSSGVPKPQPTSVPGLS